MAQPPESDSVKTIPNGVGWSKSIVKWRVGDTLYISVPFTWLVPEAEKMAKEFKAGAIANGLSMKR